MRFTSIHTVIAAGALLVAGTVAVQAADPEIEELKTQIKALQQHVTELEQRGIRPTSLPGTNAPNVVTFAPRALEIIGHASQVEDRGNLNDDDQVAAPRPNDLTLDPKYRGFIPIPNTPALLKFNAKPRVDFTSDSRNSGNPDRFVTAQIPVKGQSGFGGSEVFNVNARGSQLRLDARAPELPGNFRFYYENDFFGSGSGMQYRLKYLYGQYYNFTVGQASSVFQDPDVWPDTVDYEGPNGGILTRRPLVRYTWQMDDHWQLNVGVEQPSSEVSSTNSITQVNRAPDGGFNVRWEDKKFGHVQAGAIFRDVGARGAGVGDQNVFGWGLTLATSLKTVDQDTVQGQVTYGKGTFKYCNDDFVNNDAAYDSSGDLEALPWFGAMVGYTHYWAPRWRSTVSYGFVNIENDPSQGPDAYHQTQYASLNLIYQMREHLKLGLEGLYGSKQTQDGNNGDVWRIQMSMVWSLFD